MTTTYASQPRPPTVTQDVDRTGRIGGFDKTQRVFLAAACPIAGLVAMGVRHHRAKTNPDVRNGTDVRGGFDLNQRIILAAFCPIPGLVVMACRGAFRDLPERIIRRVFRRR